MSAIEKRCYVYTVNTHVLSFIRIVHCIKAMRCFSSYIYCRRSQPFSAGNRGEHRLDNITKTFSNVRGWV